MAATAPGRPRSGNRRDEAARLAVLHAADDLLVEHGFGALTVEAIARRAGVAKQTIYRWWPSKVEILLDTLTGDLDKRLPLPDAATLTAIRDYLRALARFVTRDPAGRVMLALLAEAQHDPATATLLHERALDPRRRQEVALLTRAVAAGEIAPRLAPDVVVDALIGMIIHRALHGANVPRAMVDTLVADLLEPRFGPTGEKETR